MARRHSTSRTLRLSRSQYRSFAEHAKSFGLALNISTYKRMGGWGAFSPMACAVHKDATFNAQKFDEQMIVDIAASVSVDRFRAAGRGRPEVDWSALEDHEIYPFILEHEIGHRQDNFSQWDAVLITDVDVKRDVFRRLSLVNEVLADRYAWERIRPGEQIPLGEHGRVIAHTVAESMELVGKYCQKPAPCRPDHRLAPGMYRDVPDEMFATRSRAAFIGPNVNKDLLSERCAYYAAKVSRVFRERGRTTPVDARSATSYTLS